MKRCWFEFGPGSSVILLTGRNGIFVGTRTFETFHWRTTRNERRLFCWRLLGKAGVSAISEKQIVSSGRMAGKSRVPTPNHPLKSGKCMRMWQTQFHKPPKSPFFLGCFFFKITPNTPTPKWIQMDPNGRFMALGFRWFHNVPHLFSWGMAAMCEAL